ncbi:MAG TPA: SDR family NAD(P)-dependent oxidoreductase [Planctomycetota bacterium]|nr:SDR family NAD(P)-dependent oxidoreductase [Planctomycetota bacterium]
MAYADKVVLVTGGSRGIGEGCVRVFADAGAKVAFCSRAEKPGRSLEAKINLRHPGAAFYQTCDMSRVEQVERLVDETVKRFGRLDCLINNAGTHPGHRPIDDFSVQELRDLIELNLVGVFAACKRALPHLRKTKGSIINISSLVGQMGQIHATPYVATKGAVTALTKALAIDEAANDVRVNSVSPGNIWTPLWQSAVDQAPDPVKCKADGDAAQLMGRMGTIEEAGKLCLFLAAEATFTTGVDHILSGGAELAYGRKTRK